MLNPKSITTVVLPALASIATQKTFFNDSELDTVGFNERQRQAIFATASSVTGTENLPTTLAAFHQWTQQGFLRPRLLKEAWSPGFEQWGLVSAINGPKGERAGYQDTVKLKAIKPHIIANLEPLGFLGELFLASTLPKSTRVLSLGAMFERVEMRMSLARNLVDRGLATQEQVYFAGSGRPLFPAELEALKEHPHLQTEGDMVKFVAERKGFVANHFLGAHKEIIAPRATTLDEGKALAAATTPSVESIVIISNAPFHRRQALDVFRALWQENPNKVPVVIAIGDELSEKTPTFILLEEVTYWIHSAKSLIDWTHQNRPEQLAEIQKALSDILHMGRPGYTLQSQAYRNAFPQGLPIQEKRLSWHLETLTQLRTQQVSLIREQADKHAISLAEVPLSTFTWNALENMWRTVNPSIAFLLAGNAINENAKEALLGLLLEHPPILTYKTFSQKSLLSLAITQAPIEVFKIFVLALEEIYNSPCERAQWRGDLIRVLATDSSMAEEKKTFLKELLMADPKNTSAAVSIFNARSHSDSEATSESTLSKGQ